MLRWRGKELDGMCCVRGHLVDEVEGHAPAHDADSDEAELHHLHGSVVRTEDTQACRVAHIHKE